MEGMEGRCASPQAAEGRKRRWRRLNRRHNGVGAGAGAGGSAARPLIPLDSAVCEALLIAVAAMCVALSLGASPDPVPGARDSALVDLFAAHPWLERLVQPASLVINVALALAIQSGVADEAVKFRISASSALGCTRLCGSQGYLVSTFVAASLASSCCGFGTGIGAGFGAALVRASLALGHLKYSLALGMAPALKLICAAQALAQVYLAGIAAPAPWCVALGLLLAAFCSDFALHTCRTLRRTFTLGDATLIANGGLFCVATWLLSSPLAALGTGAAPGPAPSAGVAPAESGGPVSHVAALVADLVRDALPLVKGALASVFGAASGAPGAMAPGGSHALAAAAPPPQGLRVHASADPTAAFAVHLMLSLACALFLALVAGRRAFLALAGAALLCAAHGRPSRLLEAGTFAFDTILRDNGDLIRLWASVILVTIPLLYAAAMATKARGGQGARKAAPARRPRTKIRADLRKRFEEQLHYSSPSSGRSSEGAGVGPPAPAVPNIVLRKAFHFVVLFVFLSAIGAGTDTTGSTVAADAGARFAGFDFGGELSDFFESTRDASVSGASASGALVLLSLCSACLLAVLVLGEYVRINLRLRGVTKFLRAFTDARDSGTFIFSHLSLLLGAFLPVWLELFRAAAGGDRGEGGGISGTGLLPSVCGVLALGVADVLGVLVGKHFGKVAICKGSKKTVEGTAAALVGTVGFALACNRASGGALFDFDQLQLGLGPTADAWGSVVGLGANVSVSGLAAFVSLSASMCLLEAFTLQLDNIYVPLFFYVMLRVATVP